MINTILLTGASGFLGWHLIETKPKNMAIVGTYFKHLGVQEDVQWQQLNLIELEKWKNWISKQGFDAIIHTAAVPQIRFCEEHPALSYHINVYATITLAKIAEELDIPFIFCSTDLVFNGNNPPYDEESFPHPLSKYGEQKIAAEDFILADYKQAYVCRLPLMFGVEPSHSANFLKSWTKALEDGEPLYAFEDEFRTPLSGWEGAKAIWHWVKAILRQDWDESNKIYHIFGEETVSRYEFARMIAEQLDIANPDIRKGKRKEVELGHLRPQDTSLVSIYKREYTVPSLKEQLQQVLTQYNK